jgi:hypothetical protein
MPRLTLRPKTAERRVIYELEKRGLPTFGNAERRRARLERHLAVERKPVKKQIAFDLDDDETPIATLSLSFHGPDGRAFPILRHPVMNPETDINWDAEMNQINEAAERDDEVATAEPREEGNNEQREEGEIRDEEGVNAWQNFIEQNQVDYLTDLYRAYINARIVGCHHVLDRYMAWTEYEEYLFPTRENGFENTQNQNTVVPEQNGDAHDEV